MSLRKPAALIWMLFASSPAILLIGCGSDDTETLYPVNGRVLQGTAPIRVKSGYVLLKPDVEKGNQTQFEPSGQIEADGSFVIYTNQRPGAPPGWYKVVVTATGEPERKSPGKGTSRPTAKQLLPPKYGQAKTTPLSIEVVESPAAGAYDLDVSK